jgi:hypothetical protein
MKKLLLLILSALAFSSASAQTEKGTTYWGASIGNVRYNRTQLKENLFSVSLYPTAGKFVTDKLLLGLTANLGYNSAEPSIDTYVRTISYGAVPFARYYFEGTDKHRFFGQLNAGLIWRNSKLKGPYGYGTGKSYTTLYGTGGVALGYNYSLTPGAALEATAGYNRNGSSNQFYIGTLDIRAGFAIFLPTRQAALVPTE